MASAPSQATKLMASAGAGVVAAGFAWYGGPWLQGLFAPVKPWRIYQPSQFEEAAGFAGLRQGFIYKKDHLGLGYYQDLGRQLDVE
mmetsp:Transcript_37888/g.100237  ORF Transcript_37888/g.100237 Transcript_37888/m.100237 type:complete len:86 (+) Transcript_37888:128-385(+)